jgi:hypothetical protein
LLILNLLIYRESNTKKNVLLLIYSYNRANGSDSRIIDPDSRANDALCRADDALGEEMNNE